MSSTTAAYRAESVRVDTDEDGFALEIETDEGLMLRVNVQACAEQVLEQARERIEPWVLEGRHAVRRRPADDDDKHPDPVLARWLNADGSLRAE